MQTTLQRSIKTVLFCAPFVVAIGISCAFAQGSAGGSIGNDEKSLSGTREAPRSVEAPARRSRSEPTEPRRAAPRSSGGGGGNFDGAWVVNSVGCGSTTRGAVVVTSGRVIGEGVTGTIKYHVRIGEQRPPNWPGGGLLSEGFTKDDGQWAFWLRYKDFIEGDTW